LGFVGGAEAVLYVEAGGGRKEDGRRPEPEAEEEP